MDAASEQRMTNMLARIGIDPAIAKLSEPITIADYAATCAMKTIRQRCRTCPVVTTCEQWLARNEDSDNAFCPNSGLIDELRTIFDDIVRA